MTSKAAPRWLTTAEVLYLHDLSIANHGGLPGLRNRNGLESAVARPQQFHAYEGEDCLFTLAAIYAEGILAHNHPFHDGNKRTGYLAADMFLFLNGRELVPADHPDDRVRFFEGVADGTISREELSRFYAKNTVPRSQEN